VALDAEALWLSQEQLTTLFGRAKGTISEHVNTYLRMASCTRRQLFGYSEPFKPNAQAIGSEFLVYLRGRGAVQSCVTVRSIKASEAAIFRNCESRLRACTAGFTLAL
jgi:hypothetical protein